MPLMTEDKVPVTTMNGQHSLLMFFDCLLKMGQFFKKKNIPLLFPPHALPTLAASSPPAFCPPPAIIFPGTHPLSLGLFFVTATRCIHMCYSTSHSAPSLNTAHIIFALLKGHKTIGYFQFYQVFPRDQSLDHFYS